MLNDWVYLSAKGRYPMQIESIDRDHCFLDFDGNESDPFDGIYGDGGIAPIPLTDDILDLNFQPLQTNETWTDNEGVMFIHKITSTDGKYIYGLYNTLADIDDLNVTFFCRYVHQLQHLLRALGMIELANNFKIK